MSVVTKDGDGVRRARRSRNAACSVRLAGTEDSSVTLHGVDAVVDGAGPFSLAGTDVNVRVGEAVVTLGSVTGTIAGVLGTRLTFTPAAATKAVVAAVGCSLSLGSGNAQTGQQTVAFVADGACGCR